MKNKMIYPLVLTVINFFLSGCSFTLNEASKEEEIRFPKNIILMIGDGMGLGQISAAMYKNGGELSLEKSRYVGLLKTNSASYISIYL